MTTHEGLTVQLGEPFLWSTLWHQLVQELVCLLPVWSLWSAPSWSVLLPLPKTSVSPRAFSLVFFLLCILSWRNLKVIKSVSLVSIALLTPRRTYRTEIYMLQPLDLESRSTSDSMDPYSDTACSSTCAHSTVVPISSNVPTSFLAVQDRNL